MRADMTFFGFSLIFSFWIDAREPRCASPGKSKSRQKKRTKTCHNVFATRDEKKKGETCYLPEYLHRMGPAQGIDWGKGKCDALRQTESPFQAVPNVPPLRFVHVVPDGLHVKNWPRTSTFREFSKRRMCGFRGGSGLYSCSSAAHIRDQL